MEEIKIAFAKLQPEPETTEFLLYKRVFCWLLYKIRRKDRIKKAIEKTVCIERQFADMEYPLFILPFSKKEFLGLKLEEMADVLNRLSASSDTGCFFYESQLASAVPAELLSFCWVNEKTVFYIQKRELLPLCSKRLNVRLSRLRVLLIESYHILSQRSCQKKSQEILSDEPESQTAPLITRVILQKLCLQTNSLCILTEKAENYQELADQIYEECGLVIGFVRQIPTEVHLLVDVSREPLFPYHQLPKSCAYLSFFWNAEKKRILTAKRKDVIQI